MTELRYVEVHGARMAYREAGRGDPVVFLHGNPTSSYLWRNVLGHVSPAGRCVAPDLIGMGGSDKLPGTGDDRYRFVAHCRYLAGFLDALAISERVTLVGHDWGGVLAVDWARAHPAAVRGIAYLETLVAPVSWDGPNAPDPALFRPLREAAGEEMVLRDNVFVETVLPAGTVRTLGPQELDTYRRPYRRAGEDRRPTLTWPREIPIDAAPADVHRIVADNAEFMGRTRIPKLFLDGDPGALLTGPLRALCRSWPEQRETTVPGLHFLPEDSPDLIGRAIADWLRDLP